MKIFRQSCIFILPIFVLLSCESKHQKIEKIVDELAGFECKAISLRNQRFQLADKIRYAQDSLKISRDTLEINNRIKLMDNQKLILQNESLRLADSIKVKMDLTSKNYLGNKKSESEFNMALDSALKKKGRK